MSHTPERAADEPAVAPAAPSEPDVVNPHRNTGVLEQLLTERPAEARRIVARLHKNLGHPSRDQMVEQLRARGSSNALLQAAHDYVCPTCAQLAPPNQVPKSSLRSATKLNQRLMADTFWVTLPKGRTVPVLSMLDAATKYVVARPLVSETSEQFLRALERGWVKLFGPPHVLQVDAHPSWASAAVRDWVTTHGVELLISPGEAHQRLAQVERRHQVLRRAIDVFMADTGGTTIDDLRRALDFLVPQVNNTISVQGYSPTQWVLGYQPDLPGMLLGSNVNPSHLDGSPDFRRKLDLQSSAAKAIMSADNDERLRRALLRQSRVTSSVFAVGQRVYYYREGTGVGPRIRWRGPAVVTMVEQDSRGRQSVVWLVHGAQLIRAAAEHLRRDFSDSEPVASPTQALETLRGRGTTSFIDLPRTNRRVPRDEAHAMPSDDEVVEPDPKRSRPHVAVAPDPSHVAPPSVDFPAPAPLPNPPTPTVDFREAPLPDDASDQLSDDAAVPLPDSDMHPQVSVPEPAFEPAPAQPSPDLPPAPEPVPFGPFRVPAQETFAERRARIDRTETLPFHRQPAADRSRSPPPSAEPALTEQAHFCDVLPQSTPCLPPGWTIAGDGQMHLDSVQDQWEFDGRHLLRRHFVARDRAFNPLSPDDCPVPVHMLSKVRHTYRGRHRHDNRWRVQPRNGMVATGGLERQSSRFSPGIGRRRMTPFTRLPMDTVPTLVLNARPTWMRRP